MFHVHRVFVAVAVLASLATAQSWPDGKELSGRLMDLARLDRARLVELGRSAGDQKLRLLEIAPEQPRGGGDPAVLVLANLEGDLPLASLSAVELAAEVLAAAPDHPASSVRWYVLPMANPDGLDRFFQRPRAPGGHNDTSRDDDTDGLEGEDPPDDLDGDGLITWMLVDDPGGAWNLNDEGLPVTADPARSPEAVRYRRELEGHDDDGDGRYNEDPPGGVDVAGNFPHEFQAWGDRGLWPGDQPESRAVLEFAHSHPDIALVLVLGVDNNLWTVPEPNPPLDPALPVMPGRRLARTLGLEADTEYPLQTVLDAAGARGSYGPLSPAAVRARLHLDPVTRPLDDDLGWWRALSEGYRAFLGRHGLDAPRLEPTPPRRGSAANWAYFQFGVPTVACDLWSLPVPVDTTATDSLAVTAVAEPEPWLRHLQHRAEHDRHGGWRSWTEVTLDDGRRALVGGPEPGARHTPAAYAANARARALLPFWLDLAGWLPRLNVAFDGIIDRGAGVYEVTVLVRNDGRLPYPTAMGAVNRRPGPVVVELAGGEPFTLDRRRTVDTLPAGGGITLTWLVRADDAGRLSVTASAPSLGSAMAQGGVR